jgi:CDP-glucose 4,6-dehydratase
MISAPFWNGRRVLITGHTGFKGAWLCLWLESLGARVTALARPPTTDPALVEVLAPWPQQTHVLGDIRTPDAVAKVMEQAAPEIIIHLAAQALVRAAYADPVGTYATNVLGTINLLEAARARPELKAVLVVTSDKVYENDGRGVAFSEGARLGGDDPYSNSKACAELATASYRTSFFQGGTAIATARAGNVVGGGDWAADRLIPDVIRALDRREAVRLRNPGAIRPWQHVLEPLSGYLLYAQQLAQAQPELPLALNFGPEHGAFRTTAEVVDAISIHFGGSPGWIADTGEHPHEAPVLTLSSDLAERSLGWRARLSIDEALRWTADWYAAHRAKKPMRQFSLDQIAQYMEMMT